MELQIDHSSPVPLHIQVEQLLRNITRQREYQDGKLLPPEVDLAKRLGISRSTVRQAIQRLVYDGILERKKSVGTRVVHPRMATRLDAWASFTNEMNERGIPFASLECVARTEELTDEQAAGHLGIPPGTPVVRLERVKGIDGEPVVLFDSVFHPRVGLSESADFSRPLYELLDRQFHVVASHSSEEISAIVATPRLAGKLKLPKNSAILVRERLVSDPGHRPLEFCRCYYRADRFKYTIEIGR